MKTDQSSGIPVWGIEGKAYKVHFSVSHHSLCGFCATLYSPLSLPSWSLKQTSTIPSASNSCGISSCVSATSNARFKFFSGSLLVSLSYSIRSGLKKNNNNALSKLMNCGFDCALKLLKIVLQDHMITLVFESTCVCEWVHWMPVHHASLWWSWILSHCDTYILYPRGLCTLVQKITKIFVTKVQPMTKSTKISEGSWKKLVDIKKQAGHYISLAPKQCLL